MMANFKRRGNSALKSVTRRWMAGIDVQILPHFHAMRDALDETAKTCQSGADMVRFGILKQLLLVFGDYAVFQLALILTLVLRYGALTETDWLLHIVPFSILGIVWLMSLYVAGLYDLALTRDSLKFFRTFLEGMIA